MRILLLTHAYNSLAQRIDAELRQRGHAVSIEFDIGDAVTEEAVALFTPDLIIAPYLLSLALTFLHIYKLEYQSILEH